MGLSILYNISALQAENQLSITTAAANKSLQELSSGSRINSGSDDAAGLAISNGLNANIAALNQSALNSANATGALQTADGALSQISALLNRSVTLATEAASAGLTPSQLTAIDTEYTALLTEINSIGSATNFNGVAVFSASATVTTVITAYTTDGTSTGTVSISVTSPVVSATGTGGLGLTLSSITTTATAVTALTALDAAINTISLDRGTLGATVEQLQANTTVQTNESQNLTAATSQITSANIATVVANDTSYSILEQTGISALQQSNTQAQTVLKLLQ
jgi:flagellin